jgi:hypothetical protein
MTYIRRRLRPQRRPRVLPSHLGSKPRQPDVPCPALRERHTRIATARRCLAFYRWSWARWVESGIAAPLIGLDARKRMLGRYLFARYGRSIVFFGRLIALLRAFAALLAGANGWCRGASLPSMRPAALGPIDALIKDKPNLIIVPTGALGDERGLLAGRRPLLRPRPLDETCLGVADGPWPDCRRNVEGGCVSLCSDIYWLNANDGPFHFPLCRKLGNGRA